MTVTGLTRICSPKPSYVVDISAGGVFDSCEHDEQAPLVRCDDIPVNGNPPSKFGDLFRSLKPVSMYEYVEAPKLPCSFFPNLITYGNGIRAVKLKHIVSKISRSITKS